MRVVFAQEPEGQPLMLDRFDARWMLDMSDLSKESSSFTGAASVVCPEVRARRRLGSVDSVSWGRALSW